jgi:hypothetical protein
MKTTSCISCDTTTLADVTANAIEGLGDRMTKQAACRYLGCCARTLERSFQIPKLRWKGRVWYSRAALDQFIAARERGWA